jgi:hypothetical protein
MQVAQDAKHERRAAVLAWLNTTATAMRLERDAEQGMRPTWDRVLLGELRRCSVAQQQALYADELCLPPWEYVRQVPAEGEDSMAVPGLLPDEEPVTWASGVSHRA